MPARLLNIPRAEVIPVLWEEDHSPKPVKAHPNPEPPAHGDAEIRALRTKIDELTAAMEVTSRKAYESGRQAGEAAVRQALEGQFRTAMERLAQTITGLAGTRDEALRRAETDTVGLAIEIARRVLHRELSIDPSSIEALVKAALEKLRSQEICRVKVHPEYESLLRACLDKAGRSQSIEVISDPSQPKGGVSFELSRGALDASVETQLREIEQGLADELQVRK